MKADKFRAVKWARSVPTIMVGDKRKRVDERAHHALLLLATWADREDGANITVGLATFAAALRVEPRVAAAVLDGLEKAGLIRRAAARSGVDGWALCMDAELPSVDPLERRAEQTRQGTRQRMRRLRERQAGDALVSRHVTPCEGVTDVPDVTAYQGERDALVDRHVTAYQGERDALGSVTSAGQSPLPPLTTKDNHQKTNRDVPSARGEEATSELFPVPPTEPSIDQQTNEIATRYYEAMGKMVAFKQVRAIVKHALQHYPYETVNKAVAHMAKHERHRSLNRQNLLAAIEGKQPKNTPYRNPEDQSVYDGGWGKVIQMRSTS